MTPILRAIILPATVLAGSLFASACSQWDGDNVDTPPVPIPSGTPAKSCVQGYEDPCFLSRIISEQDVGAIRADYTTIRTIYPNYRSAMRVRMGADTPGSPFAAITEDGLALAFATEVAYEAMPYRDASTSYTVPASRENPADLLADGVGLVCDEYADLVIDLFYELSPQGPGSPVKIMSVGWRSESPVGNHAEIFVTGTGTPMLLDPTYAFIEAGTLADVLSGIPLATMPANLAGRKVGGTGRANVKAAFSTVADDGLGKFALVSATGAMRPSPLMYSFIAHEAGQLGGNARDVNYTPDDFIDGIAPGASGEFFYRQTTGSLWLLDATGARLADANPNWSDIAGRTSDGTVEAVDATGDLYVIASNGKQLVQSGVVALSEGLSGNAVFGLTTAGRVFEYSSTGITTVTDGAVDISVGRGGAATYVLDTAGNLSSIDASGVTVVASGISRISEGRGAEDFGRSILALSTTGELLRLDSADTWTTLHGGAADFVVGLSGHLVTVLTTDGQVLQASVGGTATPTFAAPDWLEGGEPATAIQSIELIEGDLLLSATATDGTQWTAVATAF